MTADVEELRTIGLFSALDDEALRVLSARLARVRLPAGQTAFVEGDPSHALYVVSQGEMEIVKRVGEQPIRVALLGPGEWFGEVGLIGVSRRTASARATADAVLYELPARELRELYQRDTRAYALLSMNLARGLARKLQAAEARLAAASALPS